MVEHKKRLTIILGLNMATVFVTSLCFCFECLVLISTLFASIYNNRWDQWDHCLYCLFALSALWLVSFLVALFICRKRLIIEGRTLRITKGKEILYQCDVSEIKSIERERFSPLLKSDPGGIIIVNFRHPIPKDILLSMSWFSYKRAIRTIAKQKRQT